MKVLTITKNAVHGGVERIIELHNRELRIPVVVAGGLDNPYKTCPFPYYYCNNFDEICRILKQVDVVIYHWLSDWALSAIKKVGVPAIEYVHRIDTSECDKTIPRKVIAHSKHIIDYLKNDFPKLDYELVPYPVDLKRFKPIKINKTSIGGITSYYPIKGLDIIIKAWSSLQSKYDYTLEFYGSGEDLSKLKSLALENKVKAVFNPPVTNPEITWNKFTLGVSAATMEGGAPLAIIEALCCNTPVVASDLPGCIELNRMAEEKGLPKPLVLFKINHIEELTQKIDYILQNPYQPRAIMEELFPEDEHLSKVKQLAESLKD